MSILSEVFIKYDQDHTHTHNVSKQPPSPLVVIVAGKDIPHFQLSYCSDVVETLICHTDEGTWLQDRTFFDLMLSFKGRQC